MILAENELPLFKRSAAATAWKSLLAFLNEYWYMKLNVTFFQTWPDFQILFFMDN